MGNNKAFTNFEWLTMDLYNKGYLNKDILSSIMEQFRGDDIDSGGRIGDLSNDGLCIEELVLKVFEEKIPVSPIFPLDYESWSEEDVQRNEGYMNELYEAFHKITDRFGWC